MKQNFFVLDKIPVQVNPEDVVKQLGYPHAESVPSAVRKKVNTRIAGTLPLIEPKAAYLTLKQVSRKEFEPFAGAEAIVLALATIGEAVESRAGELVNSQQGAAALIVDAIGTIAVEQVADFLERKIRRHCAGCGWKVSRRYAPGYCGWNIQAQREIFSHFPDTLGIKLTAGCLMIPEKSLSFVCLLSRNGDSSMVRVRQCRQCKQKDCPYRSEPYKNPHLPGSPFRVFYAQE